MEKDVTIQVHVPYEILIERVDDALDLGINPEIYIDGEDLDDFDEVALGEIGRMFRDRGLRITQHGPYIGLNPAGPDEETRLMTVARYREAFRAAEAMRPATMVLHAGYSARRFRGSVEMWLERGLRTWREFVPLAEDLGVVIAAENIFEREPTPLAMLAEAVDSPFFGLCIDSGHLNVFSEVPPETWFGMVGGHVRELHLHDNRGTMDEHLPIGEGTIDFAAYFELVRRYTKDPIYTIEPHGEDVLTRALEAARRFLGGHGG